MLVATLLIASCGNGAEGDNGSAENQGGSVDPGHLTSGGGASGSASEARLSQRPSEIEQAERFSLGNLAEQHPDLIVVQGRVNPGQTLGHLLGSHGVSNKVVHVLATDGRDVFDARKIKPDQPWWVFKSADGVPLRFVYTISLRHFVVFNLEAPAVSKGALPVSTDRHTARGVINNSLSYDFDQAGLTAKLAIAMAGVYAWTVDFSRVQKGDSYRIIYEQDQVAGKNYDMPRILAAVFTHQGKALPAYRFHQGDKADYFDDSGASLRKAFLKAPLEFSRISSHYNKKRFHPVLNKIKPHLGTDYAAPTGTPILAVGDGVVSKASYTKGNGKYVKIRHNSTYDTQYLHMSKRKVKKGDRVSQGDVIGYVGSTGLATGPHVCFRFWKNGVQVNHLKEDFPPSDPITSAYENAFNAHAQLLRNELSELPDRGN